MSEMSRRADGDQPDEPEHPTEREVRAVHLRWLGAAAAGKDPRGLLEDLYSLRSRRRWSDTEPVDDPDD
jgi:hypothetical protein